MHEPLARPLLGPRSRAKALDRHGEDAIVDPGWMVRLLILCTAAVCVAFWCHRFNDDALSSPTVVGFLATLLLPFCHHLSGQQLTMRRLLAILLAFQAILHVFCLPAWPGLSLGSSGASSSWHLSAMFISVWALRCGELSSLAALAVLIIRQRRVYTVAWHFVSARLWVPIAWTAPDYRSVLGIRLAAVRAPPALLLS